MKSRDARTDPATERGCL